MNLLYEHEVKYISANPNSDNIRIQSKRIRVGDNNDYFFNFNEEQLHNIRCFGLSNIDNPLIEPNREVLYEFTS